MDEIISLMFYQQRIPYILHQVTGSRGYTGETYLRGLKTFDFLLVHGGGLRLYSQATALGRQRGLGGFPHE